MPQVDCTPTLFPYEIVPSDSARCHEALYPYSIRDRRADHVTQFATARDALDTDGANHQPGFWHGSEDQGQ